MSLSPGTRLGPYQIHTPSGAGGMGQVWRAHDTRLERDVALKVLPAGMLADEPARRRFRQEGLALSKLNHPNIAAVYDFDTQEGRDFLVMEYIPGVTLSEKLGSRLLPEQELLALGMQLADGLVAAHEQGIVHRDLKPHNLRITPEKRLKILDFGLATLARSAVAADSTASLDHTESAAGTLPYMAPEQLQGQVVDARSDIWGSGVVLYEMATGRLPFDAKLPTTLTDHILHAPARPPSRLNVALSVRLEDIILKCLEKEPANRYQSSKELLVDLRRLAAPSSLSAAAKPSRRQGWRTGTLVAVAVLVVAAAIALLDPTIKNRWLGSSEIDSVAVLPFANRSQDPEQDYFADGVAEALINELSRIKALKVISMSSVLRYRNTDKTAPQIAQELNGVRGIVEGSVMRDGGRVRVTAQLIDARTDRQIWAETYDRDLRDVLNLQTELARAIGTQIQVKLTAQEDARLASARQVIPEAHAAYLKGRYFANRAQNQKAIASFEEAISKDPNYAPAYAELALQYAFSLPANEFMPKAKTSALKAVELDESLAEAHVALATVASLYEWQWAEAEKECKRALELDPGSASAHVQYAYHLITMGRTDEAVAEAQRAAKLDPLSLRMGMNYGRALYFDRRYDEAIAQHKKTLELDPNFAMGWMFLGVAEEQKGQYAEAIAHIGKSRELSGDKKLAGILAESYNRGGYVASLKAWAKYWEPGVANGSVQPTSVAMILARAGEKDKAFEYLEQGFREHTRSIVNLKAEPQLDSLRSDPRFADLVRRMGLPK